MNNLTSKKEISVLFLWLLSLLLHPLFAQNSLTTDTTRASQWFNEAIKLNQAANYKTALEKAQAARQIFKETLGDNHSYFIKTEIEIASILYKLGHVDSALAICTYYLPIVEKTALRQTDWYCTILVNIGAIETDKGNPKVAMSYDKKALECRLGFESNYEGICTAYMNIGINYKQLGQVDSALIYYSRADNYAKKKRLTETVIYATLLQNYSSLYSSLLNDENKAIEYTLSAVDLLKRMNSFDVFLANNYYNLAISYRKVFKYPEAIRYVKEAAQIYAQNKNFSTRLAVCYQTLANTYRKMSEKDSALIYYQKAIELKRQVDGETQGLGLILADNANFYSETGDYDRADSLYMSAQALYNKYLPEKNRVVAVNYYNIAYNQFRRKNYQKAIDWFKKALKSLNYTEGGYVGTSLDPSMTSFTLLAIIENNYMLYLKTHDSQIAQESQKYAQYYLNVARFLEEQMTYTQSKFHQLEQGYPAYEAAIATISDDKKAFSLAEQAKSAQLHEIVRDNAALNASNIPDSIIQELKRLQVEINQIEKKRQTILDAGKTELDSTYLTLSQNVRLLRDKETANKASIEKKFPNYYKIKLDKNIISLTDLQNQVLKHNQTLVQYFVGDTTIFIFTIKKDYFDKKTVIKDFPLDEWVRLLRGALSADSFRLQADIYANISYKLYEKLIKPIKSQLSEDVIIVPDGILGYIPFEALLTQKPEKAVRFHDHAYLLRDHSISYSFSATLLREMMQKKHRMPPSKSIITYAPFFDGDTTAFAKIFSDDMEMRQGFIPLSNSGEEAFRIAKIMGGEALTGKDVTENKFLGTAPNARIIHLATHGKADDKSSDYSFLAFSPLKDSIENELLYVRDLYNMTLNADMVVLSACETGIGKLQRGEGVISLARAFAYAGAKSIVTSLWAVNDTKTKDLMLLFYKNLKKGKTKDAALREAKLSFIDKNAHPNAHPFFWAAFIGIGDMSAVR